MANAAPTADVGPRDIFGHSFTSSIVLGNDLGEVPLRDLDSPPFVIPLTGHESLAGMSGRIGMVASVTKEGKVHWAIASHGPNDRLREPSERAVRGWLFSVPRRQSIPVAAYVNFTVVFRDGRVDAVVVDTPDRVTCH